MHDCCLAADLARAKMSTQIGTNMGLKYFHTDYFFFCKNIQTTLRNFPQLSRQNKTFTIRITVQKKRDKQNIQKFPCEKVISKKYIDFSQIFIYILEISLVCNSKEIYSNRNTFYQ